MRSDCTSLQQLQRSEEELLFGEGTNQLLKESVLRQALPNFTLVTILRSTRAPTPPFGWMS